MKENTSICLIITVFLLSLYVMFTPRALASSTDGYDLTIVNRVGDEARFQKAVELFNKKYPTVRVVERQIDDPRVLATEIMAGGEGIDLIGLQDSFMTVSAAILLKNGALEDLNRHPELLSQRELWIDMFGFVTIDGHWYAVPEIAEVHLFQVNTDLAEMIGWQIPTGRWSQSELTELASRIKEWNDKSEKHIYLLQEDTFLMPYFFHEYQANHVDIYNNTAAYDTEEYIELLRTYQWLNDNGLFCKSYAMLNPKMRPDTLLLSVRFDGLPSLGEGTFILPPGKTGKEAYPVYGCVLSVSANTPHMEEAVYFIYCYMSREALELQNSLSWGFWLKDGMHTQYAYSFEHISDENRMLWNFVLENSVPEVYLYDISREQYKTLFPALLEGKITPERFAAISQQLADMALGE